MSTETKIAAYIELQTWVQREVNRGNLKPAITTDSIRASLRNEIANETGWSCQVLQDTIEAAARKKATGQ